MEKARAKAEELGKAVKDTAKAGAEVLNAAGTEFVYGEARRQQLAALNDRLLHCAHPLHRSMHISSAVF